MTSLNLHDLGSVKLRWWVDCCLIFDMPHVIDVPIKSTGNDISCTSFVKYISALNVCVVLGTV